MLTHKFSSILILGMHRSGSSCLAGSLCQRGLHLGEVQQRNRWNAKGNQESKIVREINNELLRTNGGSWYRPKFIRKVSNDLKRKVHKHRTDMGKAGQLWGIKDPRMLFCYPAWRDPATAFVGTFRHPFHVARSLQTRRMLKGPLFSFEEGLELWHQYNSQLAHLYRQCPFPIVNYDWEPEQYLSAIKNIASIFSLNEDGGVFFEEALRHHRGDRLIEHKKYRKLYDELSDIATAEHHWMLEAIREKPSAETSCRS